MTPVTALADSRRRRRHADRARRSVCLSVFRIPLTQEFADDFRGHAHVYDRHLRPGLCCVRRWIVDATCRSAHGRRGIGSLYGIGVLLAAFPTADSGGWLSRANGRYRSRAWLYRPGCDARAMVSRSARNDYRHSRGGFRRWSAHYGAAGHAVGRRRWRATNIRRARHRLPCCGDVRGTVHEEPNFSGFVPSGWTPSAAQQMQRSTKVYTLQEALASCSGTARGRCCF